MWVAAFKSSFEIPDFPTRNTRFSTVNQASLRLRLVSSVSQPVCTNFWKINEKRSIWSSRLTHIDHKSEQIDGWVTACANELAVNGESSNKMAFEPELSGKMKMIVDIHFQLYFDAFWLEQINSLYFRILPIKYLNLTSCSWCKKPSYASSK